MTLPILVVALNACSVARPAYDLLILDGTIIDGLGSAAHKGNIAITGDKIVKIGTYVHVRVC